MRKVLGLLICRFRQSARIVSLAGFFARAFGEGALLAAVRGRRFDARARSRWLQTLCRRAARLLHLEVHAEGLAPERGVMVSNHLSYLDIIAFGSVAPLVFLSKKEVATWPLVGWITRMAGTLFITREDKSEALRVAEKLGSLVGQGSVVVIFPEGTSSDGEQVLPFHPALLEPAVRHKWPVTPACVGYALDDGSVSGEVCYWGKMTFFPHLLNLMTKKTIQARVQFGASVLPGDSRKELARALHGQVCQLRLDKIT